jgi:hypothetical protein
MIVIHRAQILSIYCPDLNPHHDQGRVSLVRLAQARQTFGYMDSAGFSRFQHLEVTAVLDGVKSQARLQFVEMLWALQTTLYGGEGQRFLPPGRPKTILHGFEECGFRWDNFCAF